jgi:hypothetical protein
MKFKLTFTLAILLIASTSFAQETFKSCYVQGDSCYCVTYGQSKTQMVVKRECSDKHVVFDYPTNRKPKSLPRLGTNPQFGTLRNYSTTQEVYDHLKKAYVENEKGNAMELDDLWKAMGYAGFNDASFTVDKVTMVMYDAGVTGMLGAGGNSYLYASIAPGTNQQFKGYRITSENGCDVTIMEICGNAFFPQNFYSKSGSTIAKSVTNGTRVLSRKASKIDFPAGYTPENSTVNAFMEDGKCKLRICRKPESSSGKEGVIVTDLGHNQQFGSMVDLRTSDAVYARLKQLHSENRSGNRAELDRLLRSIGYTKGINDSRFSVNSITIENYAGGVAAVMGGGEHQYMYSEISGAKYDTLRGFNIKALNDKCDLTIIDVCGNALYCPEPMNCQTIECAACN